MQSQDAKVRGEECCRPLAASHLVSKERGGSDFIGNTLGPTPQNCVRRWKILAQSLQKVSRVEQVSFPVLQNSSDQDVGTSGRAGGLPGLGGVPVWLLWSRVQDEGETEAAPVLKSWIHQACRSCCWGDLNLH